MEAGGSRGGGRPQRPGLRSAVLDSQRWTGPSLHGLVRGVGPGARPDGIFSLHALNSTIQASLPRVQELSRGEASWVPPPPAAGSCSRHLGKSPRAQTARSLLHLHPGPKHAAPPGPCPDMTVPIGSTPEPQGAGSQVVRWRAARHAGEKSVQGAQGLSGPAACSPVSKAGLRPSPQRGTSVPAPSFPTLVPVPTSHCWTTPRLQWADKEQSCSPPVQAAAGGGVEGDGDGEGDERGGDEDPPCRKPAVVPFGLNSGWYPFLRNHKHSPRSCVLCSGRNRAPGTQAARLGPSPPLGLLVCKCG